MSVNIAHTITGNNASIILKGRFDFSCHRDFRSTYEEILKSAESVDTIGVDFKEVSYLDSSALGMLLLLREKAADHKISVNLVNVHGAVQQVLEVSNFGRLFNIS